MPANRAVLRDSRAMWAAMGAGVDDDRKDDRQVRNNVASPRTTDKVMV